MAVKIKLADLKGHEKNIDKLLTIEEKETFNPTSNFVKKNKMRIKMYLCKEDIVHIPFYFAVIYFKKIFNQTINFPKMFIPPPPRIGQKSLEVEEYFRGQLLERQVEPYNKAIEYLKKHKTVTIALYPGFGKTFLGCKLSWRINLLTCILVHRESIGDSWVKTYKDYTPLTDDEIWLVEDSKNFKIKPNAKVIISMDRRVEKIPPEMRKRIGLLIIDEAHCFCSQNKVEPLLSFSPKYIIAETATPEKDNGMHKMIYSICGKHCIQELSNKPFKLIVIETDLDFILAGKNPFGDLVNERAKSEEMNELIINLLKNNQKYKSIITCMRTNLCRNLSNRLTKEGLKNSQLHSNIKTYNTENILIGTGSKMGVGFDEANFCKDYDGIRSNVMYMTYTVKSWATFEQVRGRVMRSDNPILVLFSDNCRITKKHIGLMSKWSKDRNGRVVKIKLSKIKENGDYNIDNM